MPADTEREYYYPMGNGDRRGKERNRHSSHHVKADDQNTADDDDMASLTIVHTTGDKQSFNGNLDNSRETLEGGRQSTEIYDHDMNDDLIRDSIRHSYRLSKGNLHPHFDSPTESFRLARRYSSASKLSEHDEFITSDDGFENSPAFRRRRNSMTLALEEGELDVSGRFDSQSSSRQELHFQSPTSPADNVFLSTPSPPRTPEASNQQQVDFQAAAKYDDEVVTPEVHNTRDRRKSKKDKHQASLSQDSKTVKDPSRRRAATLVPEKEYKLRPKDLMAKLRLNFSRKSKQKDKRSPVTPVISSPIIRVDTVADPLQSTPTEENVQLRKKTKNMDPSNRLTWHGSTDADGVQGRAMRHRKSGVSPVENARYSMDMQQGIQTSKSTTNVAEFGRQLRPIADFYEEDSDGNSSSAFASPASSVCSSNPSSRPVSATDIPWERYHMAAHIRRTESEGYLKSVSPSAMKPSELKLKRHSSSSVFTSSTVGSPWRHVNRSNSGPATPPVVLETSNLDTSSSGSANHLAGKRVQRVSFEEDEKKRLQEAAKTPKPRHQPRRVKTDLGDNLSIISALMHQKTPGDASLENTPRPMRRNLRRRAISELGGKSYVMQAIEKKANEDEEKEKSPTDNNVKSDAEILETTQSDEKPQSKEESEKGLPENKRSPQEAQHSQRGHRRSDSQGSITRSISSQDIELKRSDSTETLKQRTPSVPSLVSIDSIDISKDERKVLHDSTNNNKTHDKAPYLAANLDLQAYGLGPVAIFAEALWDNVTMDETELAFKAGDVIEVTDTTDKNWWWGYLGDKEGWIPTPFIRLRVSQGETVEECMERLHQEKREITATTHGRISLSFLSNDQVRANIVHEIITTERDYVNNLRDVCEGYLEQARQRPEMFSEECVQNIFGNIEEIYSFQKNFSLVLETCIHPEWPHLSEIGKAFLNHESGFDIYSDYCNNYPRAVGELKLLMDRPKYQQFFEACRLLRNMIEINLNGFLLTPVQKICKYPLQLGELLKYTRVQHPDYLPLQEALRVMKGVAFRINERKRTIENIEKIAAWQKSILDWEGEDILVRSNKLLHSGEVTKVLVKGGSRKRTVDRSLFMFDHQLIICKKDMLGRGYQYRRRLNMDRCRVNDLPDGKEHAWNINIKNGWKVWDTDTYKMYMFCAKSPEEKTRWLQAFQSERGIVEEGRTAGVHIPSWTKEAAMKHASLLDRPSKPTLAVENAHDILVSYPEQQRTPLGGIVSPMCLSCYGERQRKKTAPYMLT
ncbi:uncharacterized protein [Amphiura filiformis]|uniref:uncharacterized protein isoform X2 n=1 Tax=Amphiura filiformis TaxID=82378 RepID=UPI003B226BC2